MSRLTSKQKATGLGAVVNSLQQQINMNGNEFASAEHTGQLLSLESLSDAALVDLQHAQKGISASIREAFEGLGLESLTDAQVEAGAVAAMALGDPMAYAQRASDTANPSMEGITVVDFEQAGVAGSLDYRMTTGLEAYNEAELRNAIPFSIAYNVQASRQDAFSEAFYPTIVITPDQVGLEMTIRTTKVFNEVRHAISGKLANFAKRSLIDASIDPSVLATESTAIVPVVLADNSNLTQFVDASLVPATVRKVDGVDVPTAPLKIGTAVDLLGISQHPGLIGAGVMDSTDSIDPRIVLERVYIKVKTGADVDVIAIDLDRLPRSGFNKSLEGDYREMSLQFRTADLLLTKDIKAVDGVFPSALSVIAASDYSVKLSVNVDGECNTETGNTNVYASPVVVSAIYDANKAEVATASGAGAAFIAATTFEVVGYTLKATRSNLNRRTRGLLLTNDEQTERYTIPVGAPISIPAPVSSQKDAADLASLITATRVRNSNQAVTTLLNYAATLKAFTNAAISNGPVPAIEGIGRYLVKPFYEEVDFDLSQTVDSIKSHERADDVAAALVNKIRETAYRMNRNSQYQTALDAQTGGLGGVPKLLIGCDSMLLQHLMVSGDNRTAGIGFDFEVVGTNDMRMRDKIVLTFVRGESNGPDALAFGAHAWIPELASTVTVNRNGATNKESQVQPRNRHVNNLPVMAMINVVKLKEALTA